MGRRFPGGVVLIAPGLLAPDAPIDNVSLQGLVIGGHGMQPAAANRNAGLVHRFRMSGYQGMPAGQRVTLPKQAIGAGAGQPAAEAEIAWRQTNTVGHLAVAISIVPTLARGCVKQWAGNRRIIDFAVAPVGQFFETAAATAVAQRFPLVPVQGGKGAYFPERLMQRSWFRHGVFAYGILEFTSPVGR